MSNQVKTVWEGEAPGFLKTLVVGDLVVAVPPTPPSCLTLCSVYCWLHIFPVCSGSTLPSHHMGFFLWWLIRLHAEVSDSLETVPLGLVRTCRIAVRHVSRWHPLLTRYLLSSPLEAGCNWWVLFVFRSPASLSVRKPRSHFLTYVASLVACYYHNTIFILLFSQGFGGLKGGG